MRVFDKKIRAGHYVGAKRTLYSVARERDRARKKCGFIEIKPARRGAARRYVSMPTRVQSSFCIVFPVSSTDELTLINPTRRSSFRIIAIARCNGQKE